MQTAKYELIQKLAVGGMAEVFLARAVGPMGFQKTLVLKCILPRLAGNSTFVEMFLREARLAAPLNHPNIVQIFDFGEANGSYFLAMEYIDGPNLRVLLKMALTAGTPLPPALCARLIASACEGLAFAHDFQDPATGKPLGLIHRDISPENLLVSRQGAVKVVDFGVAKTAGQSQQTQSGVVKGKLSYMAPEQIRSEPLDRRVDVYALGVVLYELLTGHKPFTGLTDAGVVQAILFEPLPQAVLHRPDLPPALQRILERALARDREQRYPNCRALQFELEDFILSTGQSAGAYQLSQFVTRLFPAVPSMAKTPVPTPSQAESRPPHPAEPKRPRDLPPHGAAIALPAGASRSAAFTPSLKWIPALVGVALFMTGGGYIAGARTSPEAPAPAASSAPSTEAALLQPAPTSLAAVKAPGEPGAPSGALASRENPVPPSPGTPVEPPERPAQKTAAEQTRRTERSAKRRSSSKPGRSSTARAQRGDRQAGASKTGTILLAR